MKRVILLCLLCVVCFPLSAFSLVGFSIGASVGQADYSGDVLYSSGDVGRGVMYGFIVELSSLPIVDFSFRGNYFSKRINYSYEIGGTPVGTDLEFRDIYVLALAKKDLFRFPALPVALYLGGGVGWHLINTEVAKDLVIGGMDPSQADNPITLFKNNSKMGMHGLAGAKLSVPVLPLSAYGEARYGVIFTENRLKMLEFEAGLMLQF